MGGPPILLHWSGTLPTETPEQLSYMYNVAEEMNRYIHVHVHMVPYTRTLTRRDSIKSGGRLQKRK